MSTDPVDQAIADSERMAAIRGKAAPEEPQAAEPNPEGETALLLDDETLAFIHPETGEVVGVQDAPAEAADIREICDWLGPRRTAAQAKLRGLEAEKAAWVERVNAQFDGRIKRQKDTLAYLDARYHDTLRDFAARSLVGKAAKTLKVGLLTLRFVKARPKLEVVDEATALQWAKLACPDAVKVTERVLTSLIPDDVRETLSEKSSGLRYDAGGYDVFKVE